MKKIIFVQEKAGLRKRVKFSWRNPRGMHNKVRKSVKGHIRKVKIGYGTKKSREEVKLIRNLKELENVKGVILLSSSLGARKKIELIKRAKEKKLRILNLKNPDDYIKNIEEQIKNNKIKQKEKDSKKTEVKQKKKEKEEQLNDEEKKQKEKEELDKLLTKK